MARQEGNFSITASFSARIIGNESPRLTAYVNRCLKRLAVQTGQQFMTEPDTQGKLSSPSLVILFAEEGKLAPGSDESYRLKITDTGILLEARTDIGAMRGMETLLQLCTVNGKAATFPFCLVSDAPRFTWRGLMIDCSRHFMPLDVLKRNIDGMAMVKLNVFHWHLSDDQGFRVESFSWPALHQKASNGQYYTQAEIRELIAYAGARGIRVVPEFDIPGHSTSWLAAFPQFSSGTPTGKVETGFGTFDPTFDPTNDSVYIFFDRFFGEMSSLFPDAYIHIGGDENNGKQWNENPRIQAFMKTHNLADNHALQASFNKKINAILTAHGKKMMGWDEILHPDLPKDIMVHSWRGMQYLAEGVKKGYMTVLSNGYYIDLLYPAKDHYLVDPCPDSLHLSTAEQARVLGGEATMWSELVTPATIDCRIWPRTAAIAERFWSPASMRDVADMYKRLPEISHKLTALGLEHEKIVRETIAGIANRQDAKAIWLLYGCLTPLTGYDRYQYTNYTTASVFNRMIDIASPDAPIAMALDDMIANYLHGGKETVSGLVAVLGDIANNHAEFLKILPKAPRAAELVPLSEKLSELARLAIDAIRHREAGEKPDAEWLSKAEQMLKSAEKPAAELKIGEIQDFKKLLLMW
jgi:hexosaminidase